MNFGQKSKNLPMDSKRQTEKSLNQLFKDVSSCVSEEKFDEVHEEAQDVNREAMETLDRIMELVRERDEKISSENKQFTDEIASLNTQLEDCMADTLQESMLIGMENLDNWKILKMKKENFELMYQNLLQMRKNDQPVQFFRRENK